MRVRLRTGIVLDSERNGTALRDLLDTSRSATSCLVARHGVRVLLSSRIGQLADETRQECVDLRADTCCEQGEMPSRTGQKLNQNQKNNDGRLAFERLLTGTGGQSLA